jgi:hypothetical protein
MLKQIIIVLTIVVLTSCEQDNQNQQTQINSKSSVIDSVAILNDPKNNLNIQTNSFSEIDSSGILMYKLSMGETEREDINSSYKEMPNNSSWNIIFHNTKTNDYHLLSDKKMIIRSIYLNYSSDDNDEITHTKNHILVVLKKC